MKRLLEIYWEFISAFYGTYNGIIIGKNRDILTFLMGLLKISVKKQDHSAIQIRMGSIYLPIKSIGWQLLRAGPLHSKACNRPRFLFLLLQVSVNIPY